MSTALPPRLGAVALVCLVVAAAWRCGTDKKQSDDKPPVTGTQQDQSPTPPSPALPSGWDGKSDFTDSAFEVIDE
jgi:hypothetical protein